MGKYTNDAKELLHLVGGRENIAAVSHCITRMRFVLNDPKKADIQKIEAMKVVKGSFTQAGQPYMKKTEFARGQWQVQRRFLRKRDAAGSPLPSSPAAMPPAPHSVANATSLPGRGESVQGDGFWR